MRLQTVDEVLDVLDFKKDMTQARHVRRSPLVAGRRRRLVVLEQLERGIAVGSPHHRHVRTDTLEPVDAIDRAALKRHLAFQLESEFAEKSHGGGKIVDDDAEVFESREAHACSFLMTTASMVSLGKIVLAQEARPYAQTRLHRQRTPQPTVLARTASW